MSRSEGSSSLQNDDELDQLRRGPWTVDEDLTLINYIASHGDGRWNSLARSAGLKRTGKSCRLRWLNYLRPDVRRGNITLEEQLLILELHSRWGNRWSKIAQYLPGRTDNEIKNYWRTRVQKHAKQLKCDVNSKQFKDTMRYLWMPRLVERIQASDATNSNNIQFHQFGGISHQVTHTTNTVSNYSASDNNTTTSTTTTTDSSAHQLSPISDFSDHYYGTTTTTNLSLPDYYSVPGMDMDMDMDMLSLHPNNNNNQQYVGDTSESDNFWDVQNMLFLQQQLTANNI